MLTRETSHREMSLWCSLLATLLVYGQYFARVWHHLVAERVELGDAAGLFVGTIALLAMVQIGYQLAVALFWRPERRDERDRLVAARGTGIAFHVLVVGVFAVLGHLGAAGLLQGQWHPVWFSPFATANLLLLAFVVAEATRSAAQLVLYHRGS